MLIVKTTPLELRGISSKVSGKGKMYYNINVESEDGSPHSLYCPNVDALPAGLKKGQMIIATCEIVKFGKEEKLVVNQVQRAEK